MFLILSGKKNSGKDTAIAELSKRYPDANLKRVGLADYLKEICINLYNLDPKVCFSSNKEVPTNYLWKNMPWYKWWKHWSKRNNYVTHREFLQHFGSEICRSIDDSCWVNYLLNTCLDKDTIYCISDTRFPSELKRLMEKDYLLIRLMRNPYNDKHQSETALDNFRFLSDELVDNRKLSINETTEVIINKISQQIKRKNFRNILE